MTATVTVRSAVTVADSGWEHGGSCLLAPSTSMMSGDRPETWYRPGGSGAENVPEGPTWTATRECPFAVNVTVPDMGRWPGWRPPGPSGPPSMSILPVT
jgi:hypothetical protein